MEEGRQADLRLGRTLRHLSASFAAISSKNFVEVLVPNADGLCSSEALSANRLEQIYGLGLASPLASTPRKLVADRLSGVSEPGVVITRVPGTRSLLSSLLIGAGI